MPGTLHQNILALFRDDPWLAFDILDLARPTKGTPIDRRAEIELDGETAYETRQGYPDLVMVVEGDAESEGTVVTVEAQKAFDPNKRWRIPV